MSAKKVNVKRPAVPLKFKLKKLAEAIESERSSTFPGPGDHAEERTMIAERIDFLVRWNAELEGATPGRPKRRDIDWRINILWEQIDFLRRILKCEKTLPATERADMLKDIETLKSWKNELRAQRGVHR